MQLANAVKNSYYGSKIILLFNNFFKKIRILCWSAG